MALLALLVALLLLCNEILCSVNPFKLCSASSLKFQPEWLCPICALINPGAAANAASRLSTFWNLLGSRNLYTLHVIIGKQKYFYPAMVFGPGVSILMSYGENPHYVKLPIFSEFMENSTKFMKNSDLAKCLKNCLFSFPSGKSPFK